MESILPFICYYADYAPHIFLGLSLLAGLNIPISEDLLLLTAGAFASRCTPENYLPLYGWVFLGCWISGWEAYWLGRYFGPKLYQIRWFKQIITEERIATLHTYYERFGIWTFIVGRFIPGGVRNTLFITSGMGKMPFSLFIARDFIASLISTTVIFSCGYQFGENYELISDYAIRYHRIVLAIIVTIIIVVFLRIKYKSPIFR